jgi:integrase
LVRIGARPYTPDAGAYLVPKTSLTDLSVRKLQPPEAGQVTYWDDTPGLAGFGVRLAPGGAKTFLVLLGSGRRHTIGRYPTISLQKAREKAKELVAERTLGQNRPKSITFQEAYDLFLSTHYQGKKERTKKDGERILKTHFLPKLRGERLENISAESVTKIIDRLLPTPSEANHAFAAMRTFLRFCAKRRYLKHSPIEGMSLPSRVVPRERVLEDAEMVAVYRAAEEMAYPFGRIVQLCIYTGQRRGEIAALRWEYIDKDRRTITLPPSLAKNNRLHSFPYGDMTAGLLETIPDFECPFLFPARGNNAAPFSGWSKSKVALDKKCGISEWTLHDLRRTFATNLAGLAVAPHVVERLLNHVSGTISGVAAIYNRFSYTDEMRDAMKRWEQRLTVLLRD